MRTKILPMTGVFALLVGASATAQTVDGEVQASIEGVDFALLEIAPMPRDDEVPSTLPVNAAVDWSIVRQIEDTHVRAGGRLDDALATGWIDSNIYVRIRRGEVAYFVRRPDPVSSSREATHVCRITVDTAEAGVVMPDALPFFGESRGVGCGPPLGWVIARLKETGLLRRGDRMTGRTVLALSDGATLTVEHRGGSDYPVPPSTDTNGVRSLYQMPTPWGLSRSTRQRAWIIERTDGTYDLAVRFEVEGKGARSGCIVRDAHGSFPSDGWITPELRQWCVERDREFTPDPPAHLIPRPPPPSAANGSSR